MYYNTNDQHTVLDAKQGCIIFESTKNRDGPCHDSIEAPAESYSRDIECR